MIKITNNNKYLIEYIDYLNHFDYFEDEDSYSVDVKDEMIKDRIKKVKRNLQKLLNDIRVSSGRED
jgi:hypothetical protein